MANRITQALGPLAVMVGEHRVDGDTGSRRQTIIDVLLVVPDVEQERPYAPQLQKSGLILQVRERGHRMLRTPRLDFHVHVLSPGAEQIDEYLALREWLCRSAKDRETYATTKRDLTTGRT